LATRALSHVSWQAGQVVEGHRHGLVQPAEGLLDAGVEVVSTLGAAEYLELAAYSSGSACT
jgi:hypothetical protein